MFNLRLFVILFFAIVALAHAIDLSEPAANCGRPGCHNDPTVNCHKPNSKDLCKHDTYGKMMNQVCAEYCGCKNQSR
ncbi:hypothetical protein M3Y97_00628000 [Aphelenchoides bicaudatus]|nr:hypothetical protein M3Y97_00628000 [Aphelenchoides bicaudatus]